MRPDVAVEMPRLSGPIPARVLLLRPQGRRSGYNYVAKDATLLEIRQAILKIASGRRALGGAVSDPLTDREEQVLGLAVKG